MSTQLYGIDLFSGIGGASLAMEACGIQPILHVENDKARIADLAHHWPEVPIVEDINDVEGIGSITDRCGEIFLACFGVPCQPASSAGKRKGAADARWLWPQTIRVLERTKPRWLCGENPPGILSLGESAAIPGVDLGGSWPGRTFGEILTALSRIGYDFPTDAAGLPCIPVIPALAVGSPQLRDRLWIVCRRRDMGDVQCSKRWPPYACGRCNCEGTDREGQETGSIGRPGAGACLREAVGECEGNTERPGHSAGESAGIGNGRPGDGCRKALPSWSGMRLEHGADGKWRATHPAIRLLALGVAGRVSRLRGIGNAWCPQVAAEVIRAIIAAESD